jgi:hypothetical protein
MEAIVAWPAAAAPFVANMAEQMMIRMYANKQPHADVSHRVRRPRRSDIIAPKMAIARQ